MPRRYARDIWLSPEMKRERRSIHPRIPRDDGDCWPIPRIDSLIAVIALAAGAFGKLNTKGA